MHLLYADESGTVGDPTEQFFVLAGLSVFEREPHWIEKDLDRIAARFDPHEPHLIELHGSPMRAGKGVWRHHSKTSREGAIENALEVGVRNRHPHKVRLFGAVLEKTNLSGENVAHVAFEQLSSRFDQYLGRMHQAGNTQRA